MLGIQLTVHVIIGIRLFLSIYQQGKKRLQENYPEI